MKYLFFGLTSIVIALALVTIASTQNLTVREIMAEPSIAGMRVDGEKLSPDGTKVVYLWNAAGKMPRDLYIVSTTGGDATKFLSPSDLPPPSRPPEKESKLDYGLELRDDFTKARENQFGNFEWSPDSKKLVTSYGGDLYILSLDGYSKDDITTQWLRVDSAARRRASLIESAMTTARSAGLQEEKLFGRQTAYNTEILRLLNDKSEDGRSRSLEKLLETNQAVLDVERLIEVYPQLRSNEQFMNQIAEVAGASNRLKVAIDDIKASPRYSKIRRLTRTQAPETSARFLDNDRILFSQSGNLFVLDLSNSLLTQVSRESNVPNFISVFNPTPNKPGTLIAYVVSDSSKNKALVVPNYLDEFTAGPSVRRGWTDQKVVVVPSDGSRDKPFEIKLPNPEGVSNIRRMVWAADNSSLIIDRVDKDTKRRMLFYVYNVGSKGEKIIPIVEQTDPKWQASLSSIFEASPNDPSELFFGSEVDGFNHLYLAKLEKATAEPNPSGTIRQENPSDAGYTGKVKNVRITSGSWQVEWAKWTNDDEIVFASTEKPHIHEYRDPGYTGRHLHLYRKSTGNVAPLQPGDGMRTGFQISETARIPVVLYEGSEWDAPGELYVQKATLAAPTPTDISKLTSTGPVAFRSRKWIAPVFLEIPSRDKKMIPAKIYLPAGFNAKGKSKYPMVVFVHGAGYLQNVINGWNNYYREFMFNELLTQKGYVVLDIDYRGSAGYGRDWRTDVYDFLGGKDYDDHIDSIDYMVANYSVNPAKVGVYGGSYGGFMAGMLATRAPDKIAAAAALRPVFDWKNYYASSPGYTAQRLGFPDKNPEAYKRSSPITYADKLERPLLILHGMSDDNVHVQDSIQMMEKLIRLGKTQYFETMLYPSENHGFVRPESWTDEYERILAFFEKHLK